MLSEEDRGSLCAVVAGGMIVLVEGEESPISDSQQFVSAILCHTVNITTTPHPRTSP